MYSDSSMNPALYFFQFILHNPEKPSIIIFSGWKGDKVNTHELESLKIRDILKMKGCPDSVGEMIMSIETKDKMLVRKNEIISYLEEENSEALSKLRIRDIKVGKIKRENPPVKYIRENVKNEDEVKKN